MDSRADLIEQESGHSKVPFEDVIAMNRTRLGSDLLVPRVGQGMGFRIKNRNILHPDVEELIKILRFGVEQGLTFLDTAEGYCDGFSEEIVSKVIVGEIPCQIATKFSPENSQAADVILAAERSLKRLQIDTIDLYQIHWPNPSIPLEETLGAMLELRSQGKIRNIGVCNFSRKQLEEATKIVGSGVIVSNQVEYNIFDRHIEDQIMPYCLRENIRIIAYSPLDKGRLVGSKKYREDIKFLANKYEMTSQQLVLAWLLNNKNIVAIPASKSLAHIYDNSRFPFWSIQEEDFQELTRMKNEISYILPSQISVDTNGEEARGVYRSIIEALENKLGMVPSPLELSKELLENGEIKPVRVIERIQSRELHRFDLIEGRIRFWAWVIAFGFDNPIPAYLVDRVAREE